MKHISFKTLPLVNPDGSRGELSYREYIVAAIRQPLDGKSVGIEEMHGSLRLLATMDKATEKGVDFEDSDYSLLVQKIKAIKFRYVDPAFEQFVNDITEP